MAVLDKMIKVFVSCRNKKGIRRTAASDFWREDFGLSRSLVERVSWEAVLRQSSLGTVDIFQERNPKEMSSRV